MKRPGLNKSDVIALIVVTVIIVISSTTCSLLLWHSLNSGIGSPRVITATVTDKGIKAEGQSSTYLIYTRDDADNIEVMMVKDNLFAGRFDASDDYAAIEVGKKYRFTVRGPRMRFLSWYPNIYDYEETS